MDQFIDYAVPLDLPFPELPFSLPRFSFSFNFYLLSINHFTRYTFNR